MPSTKRGVYHNLKESEYTVSNSEIVFFFSSRVYLRKFMDKYKENRCEYRKRLKLLSQSSPVNMDMLHDVALYEKIEKRGFHACIKREKATINLRRENVYNYAIRRMSKSESLDWFEGVNDDG